MKSNANQIFYQVNQAVEGLEKMTEKEALLEPSKAFGENYNSLLNLARETVPAADSRRWPPMLGYRDTAFEGQSFTVSRYVEIVCYLKQISAILSEGIEH